MITDLTITQIITMAASATVVIFAVALGVTIIFRNVKLNKLKIGRATVSTGSGCECTMESIIKATHSLVLAQADAVDVLLLALKGRVNGEVDTARKSLRTAKGLHDNDLAEAAIGGAE